MIMKDMVEEFESIRQNSPRLRDEEKSRMRHQLRAFMALHPVREVGYFRLLIQKSNITGKILIKDMTIALIIALVLGGGTSFAAEGSLPGDLLYPVKIGVNEEFRRACKP